MRARTAAALLTLALAASAARADDGAADSVVKIFTSSQRPDFYQPWQNNFEESSSGSGAVIDGERILTNAHVVSDAIFVQVRRAGDPKKYDATVEFVAHDSDLATVKVKDPAFFKGVKALPVGELPHQRDKVAIYGFPMGGDELSITEGTISRVEVITYAHSSLRFLALQTDAAINPGNSGGPMIKDGRIVGVSFQSLSGGGAENIGYGVPAPMIQRFLKDVSDGHYDRVPIAGVVWQTMESDRLRAYHKMRPDQSGLLVVRSIYGCLSWGKLLPGDVLTAVDGVPLANDGTFALEKRKRVLFTHLLAVHQKGDVVPFDVLRDGQEQRVPIAVKSCEEDLVNGPLYDVRPKYFIYGGLVFTTVTRNYLANWSQNDQSAMFRYLQEYAVPAPEREEAVVLAFVLPHEVNVGYHDLRGIVVSAVNGRKIGRIKDLIDAFAHPKDGYQVVSFDPDSDGTSIVLDAAKSAAAGPEILAAHRIPSDRSDDLR